MTTDGTVPAELSRLASAAEFHNIPPEVIDVAKTVILDGLAVTRAGSRYVDHRNRYPGRRQCSAGSLRASPGYLVQPIEPTRTARESARLRQPSARVNTTWRR